MKKYRIWLWGIVCVFVVVTIGLIVLAPSQVAMHFGSGGHVDSWGGRFGLLLQPLLLALIAAVLDRRAKRLRNRQGITAIPVITVDEWWNLGLAGISAIVFFLLQLSQIGWL
ncbi:DUF1648 domain-containing protein [Lacticaseibacillus sp. GG6-2]